MSNHTQRAINWVEQGYVPDNIIRKGIRRMLKTRLNEVYDNDIEVAMQNKEAFIQSMRQASIALVPDKANEQHYEVPAEFYNLVLGERNKYSCCYWDEKTFNLDKAEKNALQLSCQHADLLDGQDILELGCGWGALTLWMAREYPNSKITAVSNSNSQRKHIERVAAVEGFKNVNVITCDMNDFAINEKFDRVVSVEMFEHMRNWELLFNKVSNWLKDEGKFFMHVFTNRHVPYPFEVKDSSDWMSEYFFTGGMMPCDDMPLYFQDDLKINTSWAWDGKHYAKTANAWLKNMDENKIKVMDIINKTYGREQGQLWWMRWRLFFMACAELFAYNHGQQWHVMHYQFSKK